MASSTVAPAACVFVNVTVSDPAAVVIAIFVPATKVRVSVTASATTSDCPDTTIVLNAFAAPVPVKVIVSDPAVVAIVRAPAAANVRVSAPVSATTSSDPDTEIVLNASVGKPPDT